MFNTLFSFITLVEIQGALMYNFPNNITFPKNVSFQSMLVLKVFPAFLHLQILKTSRIIYNRILAMESFICIDLTYLIQLRCCCCCFSLRLLPVIFVIFLLWKFITGVDIYKLCFFKFYFQ